MTTVTAAPPSRAHLYRAAGWGGILALVAWIAQPIVVGVLAASEGDSWPTVATLMSRPYSGAIGAVIFTGIALGFLMLVLSLDRLVARAGERSTTWRVGTVAGIASALGFVAAAGLTLAQYTSVGAGLADVAPDPALQAALIDVLAVVIAGMALVFSLGGVIWLVAVGTSARRAGVVGTPLAVLALVCAAIPVVGLAFPFSPPWSALGPLLFALVGGIALLVKSRRSDA